MTDLRQIDALVAEHVMGWADDGWPRDPQGMGHENFPKYSSDISIAWEVVEKMRADLWNVTVYIQDTQGCTMHKYNESYYLKADSIPLALCLAALKSKGVSYE